MRLLAKVLGIAAGMGVVATTFVAGAPALRSQAAPTDAPARSLREEKKEVGETSATEAEEVRLFFMTQDAGKSVAWELIDVPAYAAATKDATLALDGTQTVDGVPCNVLKVTGQPDAGGV